MKFNQYYLECLSHASYLIGDESSGRAVVVVTHDLALAGRADRRVHIVDGKVAPASIE